MLVKLINNVLQACMDVGLRVMNTVCDMGSSNVKALKLLGATSANPFFCYNGHQIVTIFDPPHLLKCTRNMLYRHDIEGVELVLGEDVQQVTASWDDIQNAYAIDKNTQVYQLLHKLTPSHIDPTGFSAMRVYVAAQVMSHTMAATIATYVASGMLQSSTALGTSQFVASLMSYLIA